MRRLAMSLAEDAGAPVGAVGSLVSAFTGGLSDVDSGALDGVAITATDETNGTWHYSTDNGSTWTAVGVVNSGSSLLLADDGSTRLYFQPAANWNGTDATALTLRGWDRTSGAAGSKVDTSSNGGSTAFSTATDTVAVTVSAVNDDPTFTGLDGTPTHTEGAAAVVLDSNVALFDTELNASTYSGATLTLQRNGGASAQDVYSATGTLVSLAQGGNLTVDGVTIATVTSNSGGTLVLTFNANATTALVTSAAQKIAYSNNSDAPPASAQINWVFSDGNAGAQGSGGALSASGSTTVTITATNDAPTIVNATALGLSDTDEDTTSFPVAVNTLLFSSGHADPDAGAVQGLAVTGVVGTGAWQYSTDGSTWTNVGTVSATQALLLDANSWLRYAPAGTNAETASFSFRAWDTTSGTASTFGTPVTANPGAGGGTSAYSSASASASRNVTAVNDAPVLANTALTLSVTEDAGAPSGAVGSLVSAFTGGSSDVDSGAVKGIAITATAEANGTWYYSTNGGTNWAAVGAVADTSALLLADDANTRLYFAPAANFNGSAAGALTLRAWDQNSGSAGTKVSTATNGGTTAFSSATDTVDVTVTAVNDAPVFSGLDGAPTYVEDSAAVVLDANVTVVDTELSAANNFNGATLTLARNGGVSAQDVFGATGTLAALTAGGILTVGGTTIGTVTTNSGGTLLLTFNGSATGALVNATLQQIAYNNTSQAPPASAQIDWVFNDGNAGAQGSGGALTASGSTTVTITAVNDAPVLTPYAPAYGSTENAASFQVTVATLLSTSVSDVDAAAVQGVAVFGLTGSGGTLDYSTDGGTVWTTVSGLAPSSALLLRATDLVRFTPATDNGGTMTLNYRAWDQTSGSAGSQVDASSTGGSTAFSSASDSVAITVASVNDAPVLDTTRSPTLAATTEHAGVPVGAVGTLVSALVDFSTPAGQVDNVSDVDSGAQLGIAVTAVDATHGSWWYSTDNGSNWLALGSVTGSSARLLAADANTRVYYQPNTAAEGWGSMANALTFRAWDGTSGSNGALANTSTNGGTTAFSSALDSASLLVTGVNDAPRLLGPDLVNNGSFTTNLVGWTTTGQVDQSAGSLRFGWGSVAGPHTAAQTLATVAGQTYELSFTYRDGEAAYNQSLRVTADGSTNLLNTGHIVTDVAGTSAITYWYSFTADSATTTITFTDTSDQSGLTVNGGPNSDGLLDNVSLRAVGGPQATLAYTENDAAAALHPTLAPSDVDSATLTSATVQITTGLASGEDVLVFSNQLGITGSYTAATGTLLLSGTATLADYQTALRTVAYQNTSDAPNTAARVVSYTVTDGTDTSTAASVALSVAVANDAPVVTAASLTLNEGETVTLAPANFGVTDPDNGSFTYSVSAVAGGYFQLSSAAGTPITTFTTADLAGGLVQFVDDGNEVAPSFSVKVNDGTVDSNVLAATINYTPGNDAPVVTAASLTLNEGETVSLAPANFGVTDPDNGAFTYTVSGVAGGYFQLSSAAGTPITTFTTADLAGGLVQFVDDGNEVAPAFSVKVNDGTVDSNVLAATINYTPGNDAPVVTAASLTLNEGETVSLAPANFGVTDPDNGSFTYTVSAISGGYFQLSSTAGTPITTFTTADLVGGLVQFVDDGNEAAPSFSVMVNDGMVDSNLLAATINYSPVNDAPVVNAVSLTLNEGETVTLAPANFGVTDPDNGAFTYTVSGVAGGYFQLSSASGSPITTFTTADLAGGLVQFVDDGNEVAPAFSVMVNDGTADSNVLAATINYTAVNDAPVLTAAGLTLNEGETVTLAPANFGVTDPDSAAFTYTISGVAGGYFQLSSAAGTPITTFTTADLAGGLVQFVDDGNEVAPAFSVMVNDGAVDSNLVAATINYTPVNDAPVLTAASLTLNEGETVTLAPANFGVTDPDSAAFTYTVNGVAGGYFQLSSAAGTPITTFTTADLAGGLVQFVDDGNEVAPGFSVKVNDGTVDSNLLAATINYAPVNDVPVVTAASLTLNEGETVSLSPANFGVTDPDNGSFTYTVSGVAGGYFQLSSAAGAPITSFTSADLTGGLVQFVDDSNEVAPSFSVKVNDGTVDSNVLAATINYTPGNDAPVVAAASLTLNEGETVTLAPANFGVTDPDNGAFTYSVSGVAGGYFQLTSAAGTPITTFTTADLAGGLVQFVDDGNEVAPAFSVMVNDGAVDSNVLAATINYTPVNDAPVLTAASLTLNEGETVTLAPANFGVTDPDNGSFTYSVSAVAGGYFQLSSAAGTPITSFTTADLAGGVVQFVDDGNEVAPAFSVKVNDGTVDSNMLAATINYTPVNDAPVVTAASLTLNEGETVTLAPANFGVTDPDNGAFTYTVSGVAGGYFQLSSAAGTPITTFTTADLAGGLVQFVDDGNEVAPAFSVKVNDGTVDSNLLTATINYTPVNDAPVVTTASLTLNEGETVTLAPANFGVTDPDNGSFTYTVSAISGGYFQLSSAAGTPITSFTSADLTGGTVQFVDDSNEVAPSFSVKVNDGTVDSNVLAATINYTPGNDAPVVTAASLTLNEGETVTLAPANFGVTDPDNGAFTYSVSGVAGGYFQLTSAAGTPITTFTTADLAGGLVQFVDDGNEVAPAFSVMVNDGAVDSNVLAATINYTAVNDAPVVTAASLTLNEGETVTLAPANFGVTDPDNGSFTYSVSGVTGGYFQLSSAAGTPITSFTTTDLASGLVQFVDDGNEVAPAFSVMVNDGTVDSNVQAATINYTAVNDAPVLTAASLTLNEGETVTLAPANFGVTDPDSAAFTYSVSGVAGGYFQLSSAAGTPITTFTTADLTGGTVQFVDDGNEVAPSFSVKINDGTVDSNVLAATINYTAVNDAPVVTAASLTLNEGETVTLAPANFGVTDPDNGAFTYTVSGVLGGYFQLNSAAGTAITTFTTADLAGGLVQIVDDGNEVAPAFNVMVNDGMVDSNVLAATINYTAVNDAPVVTAAGLTLNEGETVTLAPANFGVTDPDNGSFTYTVSAISGGYFQLSSAAGTPITIFTTADLAGGLLQFVDDGNEAAPSFSVKAHDGTVDSNVLAATINYTAVNDVSVVTAASLTLNEGETVTLAPANFGVTDPDNAAFTYSVSDVTGGYFQLSSAAGTPITSFTSADLTGGTVQFVDDGNEVAPAFSVMVNDGTVDSNVLAATINYTPVNDAPVLTAASLTLNEGETVTLAPANFGVTDPDSAAFTFSVSAVAGGYFQLSSAAGTPITTFTTADLAGGLVQFVDDGNEVAPGFSVKVNDGTVDSNLLAATINYAPVNDVPVVTAASLTLNEGETVSLSPANFGVTDPDNGSFTYSVSGVLGGYFQLSSAAGTPITSFTTADLASGLVQFVDDGNEVAPAFSVMVNDGTADSNVLAATINYTAVNDVPVVTAASLTLNEGETVTLAPANFGVTDPDSGSFTYTVSAISGGYFQLTSAAGTPVTTFTTADLAGGLVQFVDDGNEVAPGFSVKVNDGSVDSNVLAATINYTAVNDAPVVNAANLTLNEGETVTLAPANFGVTDPDNGSFTYTVSGVVGGYFQLSSASGTPITTFTTADLAGGLVQFVDDGNEVAPGFSVKVNDGTVDSNVLAATINYTPVNDAPVLTAASLTMNEGETVTLAPANFGVTDPDSAAFTYTVSGVLGGYFQLNSAAGTAITTFTTADLAGGLVQFVDDGNGVAPAFNVMVNDAMVDSNVLAATINYTAVNDAPVLTAASLTLNEGETVTLAPANFGVTDPDSAAFTYSISGVTGGYFQLSSAAGTPITSFTTADLASGLVQFVDDGNEVAPAFSVTVNDGTVDSNVLAATINYTAINDAPVVTAVGLTLNEGETVTLAPANFGVTDPDSAAFTYTVSAVAGGYFQLSSAAGTPITSFTTADLASGLVQFVDDGNEVAPAFSVTVNDGTVDSNVLAATINYTAINDAPVVTAAGLTLNEGETVTLAPANFGVTDPDSGSFTYTVSGVLGGYFQLSSAAGTPITSFTTADLAGGLVQFVDDGNEVAPAFSVSAYDGTANANPLAATITYTPLNDAPLITGFDGDQLLYAEGSGAVRVDALGDAAVWDVDNTNFSGGNLTVTVVYSAPAGTNVNPALAASTEAAAAAEDRLSIQQQGPGARQLAVVGDRLLWGGVDIGSVGGASGSGGSGGSAGPTLQVSFNAHATQAAVTAVLRSISYENTNLGAPVTGSRTLTLQFTDGSGGSTPLLQATVLVKAVDDPAVGTPAAQGMAAENQVLSVDTSALADPDGLGPFSYQWLRDGAAIAGAQQSSYQLGAEDVGANVQVRVSWIDGLGNAEAVTSTPIGRVAKALQAASTADVTGSGNKPSTPAEPTETSAPAEQTRTTAETSAATGKTPPALVLNADNLQTFSSLASAEEPLRLFEINNAPVGKDVTTSATGDDAALPQTQSVSFELSYGNLEATPLQGADHSTDRETLRVVLRAASSADGGNNGDGTSGTNAAPDDSTESPLIQILQHPSQVASAGLTAGVLWWLTRSGGLLTSILMGVPAWRHVDLLPVMSRRTDDGIDAPRKTRGGQADGDRIADEDGDDDDDFDDSAVASLFDDPGQEQTARSLR